MQRTIECQVEPQAEGMRLDYYLTQRFTYHSRNQWQQLIKDGTIKLNQQKTRSSRILQAGEIISFLPDNEEPPVDFDYHIEYEDDFFWVINKNGNLPCHPAGPFFENTLWHHMSATHGKVHIVNRLDRETSGLVLVAKTPETASKLAGLWQEDKVKKKYIALVFGKFPKKNINAEGILNQDKSSIIRKKKRFLNANQTNNEDMAESCSTSLELIGSDGQFSAVRAIPKTGRLHQIRASLFSLGFPLAGDKLYGPDDTFYLKFAENTLTENDWEKLFLKRQALHAYNLQFTHPFTAENMNIEAPIPDDLLQLYNRCLGV
jgi:23S rRNA pseudouridine955/2504/2580 synthase/23S rRNA pseudouridine1911/1915/1917 synthase